MNIIDMPFVALAPFPTNSVENGCVRPEKNWEKLPAGWDG